MYVLRMHITYVFTLRIQLHTYCTIFTLSVSIHCNVILFPFHMMNCAQWTTGGELLCNRIMSILPTYCSYTLYVIYIITCVCNSR